MKKKSCASEIQDWFKNSVSYDGEGYVIDAEQAEAVRCQNKNVIVVARAGSGKTRTLVAKMVYLIAKCGVKAEEMTAFVERSQQILKILAGK